jgi:hypothetical protein
MVWDRFLIQRHTQAAYALMSQSNLQVLQNDSDHPRKLFGGAISQKRVNDAFSVFGVHSHVQRIQQVIDVSNSQHATHGTTGLHTKSERSSAYSCMLTGLTTQLLGHPPRPMQSPSQLLR